MAAFDDDVDPGLPVKWNPCSNGEFVAPPASPLVREAARRTRADAAVIARRLGMSRRRFLLSSLGTATALLTLNGCAQENVEYASCTGEGPGGYYDIPPDARFESEIVRRIFAGEEFVFDVQSHFLDGNHNLPDFGASIIFPQAYCGEADPRQCFTVDRYLDLLFNKSQTDMAVLSCLPFVGSALNPSVMVEALALAERACSSRRLYMQGEAHPTVGTLAQLWENMVQMRSLLPIIAWKTYCHWGGWGWYLDDHDPWAPQVGQAFIDCVRRLGPKVIAVHKGLSGGTGINPYASPVDVGPAAARNPDIRFVIYHSGYEADPNIVEGPYNPAHDWGVNRLITSVRRAGIRPGGNVYAELGSTWRALMARPTQAAHVLGKLLVHFGPRNVLWGTDSIWYGSPQDQINAFRTFCIAEEFQERFGYPPLTRALKARILGLNAAKLHRIEPITNACRFDQFDEQEEARLSDPLANRTLGPVTPAQVQAVAAVEEAAIQRSAG
jgi:uncharacterized protein